MHRAEKQARVATYVNNTTSYEIVCECLLCSTPIYRSQTARYTESGEPFSLTSRPRGVQRFPQGTFEGCWMCATCRDFVPEVTEIHLTLNELSSEVRTELISRIRHTIWAKSVLRVIGSNPAVKGPILTNMLQHQILGSFVPNRNTPAFTDDVIRLMRMVDHDPTILDS